MCLQIPCNLPNLGYVSRKNRSICKGETRTFRKRGRLPYIFSEKPHEIKDNLVRRGTEDEVSKHKTIKYFDNTQNLSVTQVT